MMREDPRSLLLGCLSAVLSTGAVFLLIRYVPADVLGHYRPLYFFLFSIVLAAWLGGFRPGLLATVLGLLAHAGLRLEQDDWHYADVVGAVAFLGIGTAVSGLSGALHGSRHRAFQRREKLRVTLASIGDAVVTTDPESRVATLNSVAEALTGWTEADAKGRSLEEVFRIVNEQTREPVENPVHKALTKNEVVGLANPTVLIAKDGSERPIDDSAAPIRSREGAVLGGVLVFRDIFARRQAEEALAQRNRLIALQADASAALSGTEDMQAGLQSCTEALVRQLDVALARIWTLGETDDVLELQASAGLYTHLSGPPDRVNAEPFLIGRIEESIRDPEWARREGMAAFAGYPLKVEGRVVGVVTVFARTSLDEVVLKDLSSLAAVIALYVDRKRGEERLRQVAAALSEADRKKDEFLAMLAHELRNPLAPIRNALQVMRLADNEPSVLQSCREMMERQIQHLVRLVDDLLDVSRFTQGKVTLQKEWIELREVVNSAVDACRPLIEAAGHALTVELPTQTVSLLADPTRLTQIISNLLNNAAKYTDRGGRIFLTAGPEGDEIVVRVKDTGVGVAAEMLPCIFELFTQVDASLPRAQGGLGIGLTLVRRLVALHGGVVEAFSAGRGCGSEFVVRLPAHAAEIPAPEKQPAAGGDPKTVSALRILVVDDNRDSANSLGMLLRLTGHEVRTAHDGPDALAAAAVFSPGVVLLDIGLPGISGYEVAEKLREQFDRSRLKLVAMTGYGQDEDRRLSREAGFDAHLVKPIDLDALQALLVHPQFDHHAEIADGCP